MRVSSFLVAGFLLAPGMFMVTMLVAPSASQAAVGAAAAPTAAFAICAVLETGEIANGTIQN